MKKRYIIIICVFWFIGSMILLFWPVTIPKTIKMYPIPIDGVWTFKGDIYCEDDVEIIGDLTIRGKLKVHGKITELSE